MGAHLWSIDLLYMHVRARKLYITVVVSWMIKKARTTASINVKCNYVSSIFEQSFAVYVEFATFPCIIQYWNETDNKTLKYKIFCQHNRIKAQSYSRMLVKFGDTAVLST